MASTLEKADKDVKDLTEIVMRKHHQPLVERKIRVDILMAYGERDPNDNLIAPAVTLNGWPCNAKIKIVAYKDRVKGMGDAEMIIDADTWEKLNEKERMALVDHELQHLATTDKIDELGRPKLKMRKHDVQVGWFKCVAERNGLASQERIQAAQILHEYQQVFWPTEQQVAGSRIANLEVREQRPRA